MSDEPKFDQKFALDRFRQWHFWWLVVFSFLLIITFVYYLPTRFLQQFASEEAAHEHGEDGGMMMTDEEMHAHMDEHMADGMDMNDMMEHMMEEHSMTEHDAEHMMDEMMLARRSLGEGGGHDHEATSTSSGQEGTDHEHTSPIPSTDSTSSPQAGSGQTSDENVTALYQEEASIKQGLAVNLNISPVPYNVGIPLSLDFFVNQKPGNVPVLANQLQVEHEKLMHVVGLRSDMNEFFHIHPDFLADNPSIFSIEHTFKKPGLYKIWSSVKKDGVDYTFGHPEVNVNGLGSREEKNVSFSRNVITDNLPAQAGYQVSLIASDTVVRGREVDLSFDIHTLNGQEITVENYLGAQMHLVLIKDDWKQFIHTHPAGHEHSFNDQGIVEMAYADEGHEHTTPSTSPGQASGDEVIAFTVTFSEAGLYKAFAQFRPKGIDLPADEAILAEFWIQVEEKAPFPISQWWGLLVVSAVLIVGLSWVVNRYLKVKPEDVRAKS